MEAGSTNTRLDALDEKFDILDKKISALSESVDRRFDRIEERFGALQRTLITAAVGIPTAYAALSQLIS